MFGVEAAEASRRYLEALRKRALARANSEVDGAYSEAPRSYAAQGSRAPWSALGGALPRGNMPTGETDRSGGARRMRQFAIDVPQRHQTCFPLVGSLHDCCSTSRLFSYAATGTLYRGIADSSLERAGARVRLGAGDRDAAAGDATDSACQPASDGGAAWRDELRSSLGQISFAVCAPADDRAHRVAYDGIMAAYMNLSRSVKFEQLVNFLYRFKSLLRTSFKDVTDDAPEDYENPSKRQKLSAAGPAGKQRGTLELFQKMLLMHATYFMSTAVLGDGNSDRVNRFLNTLFDVPLFSDAVAQHFHQRATVFLVPRRHGKTWFLVPLIALLLSSFEGIRIGYTAHLRKATEPVFEEIEARLRRWFGNNRVDHVKGETIVFTFSSGAKSCVVFASSQNTNVSTEFTTHGPRHKLITDA